MVSKRTGILLALVVAGVIASEYDNAVAMDVSKIRGMSGREHVDDTSDNSCLEGAKEGPLVSATAAVNEKEMQKRRQLGTAPGYWSTDGNKIVDSEGNQVFFSGVNWDGFEAGSCIVDGIWPTLKRTYSTHVRQMAALGFNLIRLPLAGSCIQPGVKPKKSGIDFNLNPDLKEVTTLGALQIIVRTAKEYGLRVILDYHRLEPTKPPDYGPEQGLWYSDEYSVQVWLDTWKLLATLFKDDTTVVGADLWNEPHPSLNGSHDGPYWDDSDGPNNWRTAAKQAADVVQAINPGWLICVQGMFDNAFWGGSLQKVKEYPLTLNVPNKLVYSIHDYGPIVFDQPWHNTPDFPDNLFAYWDSMWGFVHDEGIAPVWIGEFGSRDDPGNSNIISREAKWLEKIVSYIREKKLVWTWFTWGPNSWDTGGILSDDWHTAHVRKLDVLADIMYPDYASPSQPSEASPPPSPPLPLPSPPLSAPPAPPPSPPGPPPSSSPLPEPSPPPQLHSPPPLPPTPLISPPTSAAPAPLPASSPSPLPKPGDEPPGSFPPPSVAMTPGSLTSQPPRSSSLDGTSPAPAPGMQGPLNPFPPPHAASETKSTVTGDSSAVTAPIPNSPNSAQSIGVMLFHQSALVLLVIMVMYTWYWPR